MKAQLLRGYGGVDQFDLADAPTPAAGAGEVRLRVRAVGLNPMDVKFRTGSLRDQMPLDLPAILGTDVAGEVLELGEGVDTLSVGDRVVGLADSGAYAEQALARAAVLAVIPGALTFEQAATLPTAAETARRVLGLLTPRPGETFLVSGASGSVGSAAVQLLVRDGVRVIGTASPANHDYLRGLGADPVGYGPDLVQDVRALAPDGVDGVFDVSGHDVVDAAIALRGGTDRIVTIADFAAGARGVTVSSGDSSAITASDFGPVLELAASGDFATEVEATFAFTDLPAAHRRMEDGHARGKIVLEGP